MEDEKYLLECVVIGMFDTSDNTICYDRNGYIALLFVLLLVNVHLSEFIMTLHTLM